MVNNRKILFFSFKFSQLNFLFLKERSVWRFRGQNSGDIEFLPSFQAPRQAELSFQFNSSKAEGNIMCTRDDKFYLKAELLNKNLVFSLNDGKTKKSLATVTCKPGSGGQFNDNKWHRVQLVKKSRELVNCAFKVSQFYKFNI